MGESINLTARRRVAGRGSRHEQSERDPGRSRLSIERQLAKLARFLLTWLAAFLMIVGLFSAFGQQLKAMSPPLRALTVSGVFVVAMNFLVMPTITRLVSRFLGPGTTAEGDSWDDRSSHSSRMGMIVTTVIRPSKAARRA